jgi:predicted TPR repeat methyltransferase
METSIDDLYRSAIELQKERKLHDAERLHRLILSREPDHPGSLHYLGVIAMETGHLEDAERLMRRSLELHPGGAAAADWLCNLAEVQHRRGNDEQSLKTLQLAIELDPTHPYCHSHVAVILVNAGRFEESLVWSRKALDLMPDQTTAMMALGRALMELGRPDEAKPLLERCLELEPDNPWMRFYYAAATGEGAPPAPPPDFVAWTFDAHAATFDQRLVEQLQYRTPELIRQAVDRVRTQGQQLDILDLGCGTGLMGERFRDLARTIIGVDVSEKMLEHAWRREIYRQLEHNDLLPSLQGRNEEMDLILAGDVFGYVGELKDVFAATARALRPGGLFAFSVERSDRKGLVLGRTGRYACSRSYIENLAAAEGFEILVADDATLRRERDQDVAGVIYVLRRPPASQTAAPPDAKT